MFKSLIALAAVLLGTQVAHASLLETSTSPDASTVPTYGTFHDRQTGFVFVRLPEHWAFVSSDAGPATHEVFHDAATGFVFVKLSTGWVFVNDPVPAPERFASK